MKRNLWHFFTNFFLFVLFFLSLLSLAASDEDCFTCHSDQGLKSKTGQSLFIDNEKFQVSVHGKSGISCVDCHADLEGVKDFPHSEKLKTVNCAGCHAEAEKEFESSVHYTGAGQSLTLKVQCKDCHGTHEIKSKDDFDSLVFPLNLPLTCEKCHLERVKTKRGVEFIKQYEKSVHFQALQKAGLAFSANCGRCHGAHDIKKVQDPSSHVSRNNIIRTCGKCHVGVERDYMEGVHGKAYIKGIEDVPVCTDCHNEHDIQSPQNLNSRVYSTKVAAMCSRCHDDETLARQYGLLTSRLKSYFNSFHGTASKFGEIRVANCASCHGYHDIRTSSDPKSSINPKNLPKTCGKCHPGAGINFAKGKIHVLSEKTTNKWAYFVKIFYVVLIAAIISVFLIFIGADLFHRIRLKWKK
jgi:predicted CXXCH cytochrome family protein